MRELIHKKAAPRNAMAPKPIPLKGLFDLDVDDAIWEDVGLDETGDVENPPPWLCDEKVRSGIRGILLRDRADEDLFRLQRERQALREWMAEEWDVLCMAIEALSEPGM